MSRQRDALVTRPNHQGALIDGLIGSFDVCCGQFVSGGFDAVRAEAAVPDRRLGQQLGVSERPAAFRTAAGGVDVTAGRPGPVPRSAASKCVTF